jgi:hypothetical protein
VKLHSLRNRALLVAPIRVVLGAIWVVAAIAAGASRPSALLAAVSAAFLLVFVAFNDPRSRFLSGPAEPVPVPPGTTVAPWFEQALKATIPSTVGVSVLAAIAVVPQPILAAFLGGVSIGLGAAAVLAAALQDPALYVDPRTNTLYRG